jgi:hypothetical protein
VTSIMEISDNEINWPSLSKLDAISLFFVFKV